MKPTTNELTLPKTICNVLDAWKEAQREIQLAQNLLKQAEQRLKDSFQNDKSYILTYHRLEKLNSENTKEFNKEVERDLWYTIVDKMGVRQFMSVAEAEKLEKSLGEGNLPELNEEEVFAMMNAAYGNINKYMEDAVTEVYRFLRPGWSKLKTNVKHKVGRKVILQGYIRLFWGTFEACQHSQKYITAMDNVFHRLDGQGIVKTHYGELYDAIRKCTRENNKGETTYFKFKCYSNGNLHIEFKRMDLVNKFNQIAGKSILYSE